MVLAFYAITGEYVGGDRHNIDTVSAALPAQQLVKLGTLDVSEYKNFSRWFVESESGAHYSNRPPGATLVAIPFYAIAVPFLPNDRHVVAPSAVASMTVTAAAMAVLARALSSQVSPTYAAWTALLIAVCTPTWPVSGTALWPHGPAQLGLALVVLVLLEGGGYWRLAPAALLVVASRPLVVVALGVIGVWLVRHRRIVPTGWLAAGILGGVGTVVLWNQALFGTWLSPYIETATPSALPDWSTFLTRAAGALLDPLRGVLFVTPLIVYLLVIAVRKRDQLSASATISAIAGLAYFLAHLSLHRYNPGLQIGYRYWLEPVTLTAPLLAVGLSSSWNTRGIRWQIGLSAIWSFAFQVAFVGLWASDLMYTPPWLPWSANP